MNLRTSIAVFLGLLGGMYLYRGLDISWPVAYEGSAMQMLDSMVADGPEVSAGPRKTWVIAGIWCEACSYLDVLDKSPVCPNCGRPMGKMYWWALIEPPTGGV